MIQVKDIVNLPENKKTADMRPHPTHGYPQYICLPPDELNHRKGYNQALSDVSALPISKDKVIGMVIFDRERLARTIADNRGGHRGFPPSSWDYQEADAIISAKSDILTIKGDV